jgi:mRNA interferase MazF
MRKIAIIFQQSVLCWYSGRLHGSPSVWHLESRNTQLGLIMREGDIILTPIPQANGEGKNRPALLLRAIPKYQDFLVCGISTQLKQYISNFYEIISPGDDDFEASGLFNESVIRLSFLTVISRNSIIGTISAERHQRLLYNLSQYLVQ